MSMNDLDNVFCSLKIDDSSKGLSLGEKQLNALKLMLKFNNKQKFEIYHFIALIFGQG